MLLEVIVSALLVALIVVGTFTGFQAVDASSASERFHNEANVLASQSQEQLRGDPVSTLEKIARQPQTYTVTVGGTTYTVTQEAKQLNGSGENSACAATQQASSTAPNFRVTSSVRWPELRTRRPVTQSSIITPPTGSALEVDVDNGEPATAGVAGVTAVVTYTPLESTSTVKLEGSTGSAGCVLFTGIRATTAKVEIREKANFVIPSGALKVPTTEVAIAPNLTTHDPVAYDEGGTIEANFTYKGESTFNGKTVTGDTFAVANSAMGVVPELELGGNEFESESVTGPEDYQVLTSVNAYQPHARTAVASHFLSGDLFPFGKAKWTAYAGDCAANNPATVTSKAVVPNEALVNPGATTVITVPMSYVNLAAHQGTEESPSATATSTRFPVKITNLSCSAASPAPTLPNNAKAVTYTHLQETNTEGALSDPFQPFGKFELCLQATATRRDKITFTNATEAGSSITMYPEEVSAAEKKEAREKEEAPARSKRESEEASQLSRKTTEEAAWTKRESEEAAIKTAQTNEENTRKTIEAEEAAARTKWKEEWKKGKITEKVLIEKEAKQTAERETRQAKEAENTTKRTNELAVLTERKKTEEASRAARIAEETATKEVRTKEEATRSARETQEASEAAKKAERVAKGAPTVESGKC